MQPDGGDEEKSGAGEALGGVFGLDKNVEGVEKIEKRMRRHPKAAGGEHPGLQEELKFVLHGGEEIAAAVLGVDVESDGGDHGD